MSTSVLILIVVAVLLVASIVTQPFALVSRPRLERFARRQSLVITAGNGPTIIRYLATTRRWRGCGLLVGLLISTGYSSVTRGDLRVNFLALFAGWFVGAVIAEWRVSTLASGSRRSASLAPRRSDDYVSRGVRRLVVGLWAVVLAYDVVGLVVTGGREAAPGGLDSGFSWRLLVWLGMTVVGGLGIATVARHVLRRPQPLAEPDVLAADDAIRGRSLHVLAGSSLALGGYLASGATASLSGYGTWMTEGAGGPIQVFCIVLAPLLGLLVATLQETPERRGQRRPGLQRPVDA